MTTRPVWAEVSLSRLRSNYQSLRSMVAAHTPSADLLAVVKADAYGHGVVACGPALAATGAHWLGVTSVEEGEQLRRALGVLPSHLAQTRILIMSSLWRGEANAVLDQRLTPQVWEPYQLTLLARAALERRLPSASVPVHLEIDTGMRRQGVRPGRHLLNLIRDHFAAVSPLAIEGVMTHFSAPEVLDRSQTDTQLTRFAQALAQIAEAGHQPKWLHAGNSATLFDTPHVTALAALAHRYGARLMLRPGLALYGYPVRFQPPLASTASLNLRPVLAWKTRITSLRDLRPGDGVGYNSIFRASRPTRIALSPIGYADGLNRQLSNPVPSASSCMLVRGRRAPIAGRISMDQTMLDVTDISAAAIGDEVVILGEQGPLAAENAPAALPGDEISSITAWEHADLCHTIPYEILCNIAARVPRHAVD